MVLGRGGRGIACAKPAITRGQFRLTVVQRNVVPPLPYQLTLLQAIPKGKIIESIIQKATELGVFRSCRSSRTASPPNWMTRARPRKAEKWRLTAIEAIKQCGSAWLPHVESPVTPREYLARGEKFELPLVASLQSDRRHPREHVQSILFPPNGSRLPKTLCVWVGPEGDFTPAEMSSIKSAGALPITLGRLVLRSETAALYALSVLNYELQSKYPL